MGVTCDVGEDDWRVSEGAHEGEPERFIIPSKMSSFNCTSLVDEITKSRVRGGRIEESNCSFAVGKIWTLGSLSHNIDGRVCVTITIVGFCTISKTIRFID